MSEVQRIMGDKQTDKDAPVIGVPGVAVTKYTDDAIAKKRVWAAARDAELSKRLDELKAEFKQVCQEGLNAQDAIANQIDGIKAERVTLEGQQANVQAFIDGLNTRLQHGAEQIAELKAKLADCQALRDTQQPLHDALGAEMATRDAEIKMLETQKAAAAAPANKRAEKLERDISRLHRRVGHHRALHGSLLT